ncbi:hypothetical protein SAMN06297129_1187 [Pseudooceanicola antarcticus]|uniref:Excalibur calcium-binding domain-containing protein n=1 Tax=Pseudooceanicola antarcticus TaxID=1247613 RepID=A0A285IHS6_9RHOB|nr:hypothetical protein [Pseudooceanicola antarcticus]PJE28955.1 hypothetical protein CVM39_10900 [Pseudooceanicola antarcticus]SNY47514.1 hypothetical protein SAMN06297129_1187 [Pseudooceanicola antarcticus]
MRELTLAMALLGLASCAPAVPDSAAGVGFGDYESYQQSREAELQARTIAPPAQVSSETLPGESGAPLSAMATLPPGAETTQAGPAAGDPDSAEALAADTQAALMAGLNSGETPLEASPSNPAPEAVNALGISAENDFAAVDAQRSIAEDREFIQENRQKYEQVAPEALPERTAARPNLAAYALETTHAPGTPLYTRLGLNAEARYTRNCAKYPSPDMAQADFLAKGGPQRDRLGLDPDGDGFACTWDPAPFRKAAGGGN